MITALGVQSFKTIISVCKPKKPTKYTYHEIILKFRTNYARAISSLTERITFLATRLETSQTLTNFTFFKTGVTCQFPNDFYENALITASVGGLKKRTFSKVFNAAKPQNF